MNKKTIIGTLAGGTAFFLLGWILYGMLLMDFMMKNTNNCIWRDMDSMVWWAMVLSNFLWAYFIALIFEWTNTNGFAAGMQRGLILGLLSSLAFDVGMFGNTTYFNSPTAFIVDVIAISIMACLVGGIIGMIRAGGGEKKTES